MSPAPPGSVLDGLARAPRLLVCCDFDGTLSHLVEHPGDARPVPGAAAVLGDLGGLPGTYAALVSGRSLDDLAALAGMPEHVHLVGSHGTEFARGQIESLDEGRRALLADVAAACDAIVASAPGVQAERKPASVAVHVRRASRPDAARVLAAVRSGPATIPGVHVTEGKEVIELAVVQAGKGHAVTTLRERWSVDAVLFVGDDVTDERAFEALDPARDVGVKVGDGETLAGWRVADPDAVVALLADLLQRRGSTRAEGP